MELSKINTQTSLQFEGIRELKVPVEAAKELTKKNGLDEVIFRAGDKDYIAFGKGMKVKGFKEPLTYDGKAIKILHIDNETNTALEGVKKSFTSIPGFIAEGAGALGGGYLGLLGYGIACGLGGGMAAGAAIAMTGGLVVAGVAVGAGLAAGGGAIYGANYKSIELAAK